MADEQDACMMVGPLVSLLKEKVSSSLLDQHDVMHGMEEQHEILKHELLVILSFLSEAENQASRRAIVKVWIEELQTAVYEANDVFDEFLYEALRRQAKNKEGHIANHGVARVTKLFPIPNRIVFRNRMANKLHKIVEAVDDLLAQMRAFAFNNQHEGAPTRNEGRETSSIIVDPEDTVSRSRDEERKKIVKILVDGQACRDGDLMVVPIVGMGGLGKTTLAQLIYNDPQVQMHFQLQMWVCVSDDFNVRDLANKICNAKEASIEEAFKKFQDELKGKRYLLVLDDIWNEENFSEKWENLKSCLKHSAVSSAVLLTTRDKRIAERTGTVVDNSWSTNYHEVAILRDEYIRGIIETGAGFFSLPKKKRDELVDLVGLIALRCAGSPLAAETLGNVLRGKTTRQEWQDVLKKISSAGSDETTILPTLKLSYRYLPPDSRLCFAYLATLPDKGNMAKDDIINRWIALGLTESSHGTRYKRCEDIISELLSLSFLVRANLATPSGKDDDKGAISFNMNDLLHDLAISALGSTLVVLDGENQRSVDTGHCRYAVFTNFKVVPSKLSGVLPAKLWSLSLLGCSMSEPSGDSLSFPKYLRVLELKEPSMQKLPGSICQLRLLGYLNLSGCSGLVQLPESFGNDLTKVLYINLSGCSALEKLPESFGNISSLLHVNLSGCCALKKLPESFGNLESVVHINLSCCHRLGDLPKSFCKLNNLEHLDLSFCSCLREFPTALGGLSNLRYLNLSHPCFYALEHKHYLEHKQYLQQLNDAWAKLTKLEYLNMSAFLNPIFCYLAEGESLDCFEYIFGGLSGLEHLDLSHNMFLVDLPESTVPVDGLTRLHRLDLSGCIRLESIAKSIVGLDCLKSIVLRNCPSLIYSFVVHTEDGAHSSNIVQLEDVSCKELEISCLEEVRSIGEAKRIGLDEKGKLEKLTLCWTGDGPASVDDETLLAQLVPPQNLERFELKGYRGKRLPDWFFSIRSHLPNLVEVAMEDIPSCNALPPLFLLPNLQQVAFRKMATVRKVDAGELSGGDTAVLRRLVRFTLDGLESLQEFNTIYRSGSEELMFPMMHELVIRNCPKLKFGSFLPRGQRLQVSPCESVMNSFPKTQAGGRGKGVEASSSSTTSNASAPAPVTRVVVKNCKVPLGDWSLLHHLPGLSTLEIWNSSGLTGSPEIIQVLSSLQSLGFYQCSGLTSLPEYLGDLTSLRELTIDGCRDIKPLPQIIDILSTIKSLYLLLIRGCPELKEWCQSKENKEKLARIPIRYEESATVEFDTTASHTADEQLPAQSSLTVVMD